MKIPGRAGFEREIRVLGTRSLDNWCGEPFRDFPGMSEAKWHASALFREQETLARVAESIKLGNYLYLGKGEEASGGKDKPAN